MKNSEVGVAGMPSRGLLEEAAKICEQMYIAPPPDRPDDPAPEAEFFNGRVHACVEAIRALKHGAGETPIDMILHCPKCGLQHVDAPEPKHIHQWGSSAGEYNVVPAWDNPPHRSHLCRPEDGGCGHIWRPADVPTNGVAAIKTKGKADSDPVSRAGEVVQPVAWINPQVSMPVDAGSVICLLQNHSTLGIQEHRLNRVFEDDVDWRFEDGAELSFDWSVIAWRAAPASNPASQMLTVEQMEQVIAEQGKRIFELENAASNPKEPAEVLNKVIADAIYDGKGIYRIDPAEVFKEPADDRDSAAHVIVMWLRAQANAETDPVKRAVFIEAHNAALAIKREARPADTSHIGEAGKTDEARQAAIFSRTQTATHGPMLGLPAASKAMAAEIVQELPPLPIFCYFKEVHEGWPEYNKIDEFSGGESGGEALVKLSDVRAAFSAAKELAARQPVLDWKFQFKADELSAFNRFCDTTEDDEGYDVPKPMMERLAEIGLVYSLGRARFGITSFGWHIRNGATAKPADTGIAQELPPLPEACYPVGTGKTLVGYSASQMREYARAALSAAPQNPNLDHLAGGKPEADTSLPPLRGSHIKETWSHGAGAYARCSYCGRYSDNPHALTKEEFFCDCGKARGWSGSFIAPDENSRWSGPQSGSPLPNTAGQPNEQNGVGGAAQAEQDKLVAFFRGEGHTLGKFGDDCGWTPEQTAIQAMRELLRLNPCPALSQQAPSAEQERCARLAGMIDKTKPWTKEQVKNYPSLAAHLLNTALRAAPPVLQEAKEAVRAIYPDAYAHQWADQWVIYSGEVINVNIGEGATRNAAWENARASRAQEQKPDSLNLAKPADKYECKPEDAPYQVVVDRRDIFAFLRGAWREGHSDKTNYSEGETWAEASDYAVAKMEAWETMLPWVAAPLQSADKEKQ